MKFSYNIQVKNIIQRSAKIIQSQGAQLNMNNLRVFMICFLLPPPPNPPTHLPITPTLRPLYLDPHTLPPSLPIKPQPLSFHTTHPPLSVGLKQYAESNKTQLIIRANSCIYIYIYVGLDVYSSQTLIRGASRCDST